MPFLVRLLGPVDIHREDSVIRINAPKSAAMLGTLAIALNQPVSLDRLAQALWAGTPPTSAVKNLRSYAHALRGILGGRLVTRYGAYELQLARDELDTTLFITLADRGRAALAAGDITSALVSLGEAMGLWRGDIMQGVPRTEQLDAALVGLRERRLAALEDYIEARLAAGMDRELIPETRLHLASHPLRERAWNSLMLAQYRSGDVPGALATYQKALVTLRDHLGIDPGPDLVELHRAILGRDPRLNLFRDAGQPRLIRHRSVRRTRRGPHR